MPGLPARSMHRSSEARERLLSTALRLFYKNGVNRVGVDWVIEESGVALATFYRHFPSKEDLVVACVRAADEARRATVEEIAGRGGSPEDRLRAWVEAIGKEIAAPGFRGCPFINAAAEYPARDSPVRKAVEDHRKWFKRTALSLLTAAGHPEAERATRHFVMLRDGAMVDGYLEGARQARETLVRGVEGILGSMSSTAARA
jgi:AcrR family transcriptional regulator